MDFQFYMDDTPLSTVQSPIRVINTHAHKISLVSSK